MNFKVTNKSQLIRACSIRSPPKGAQTPPPASAASSSPPLNYVPPSPPSPLMTGPGSTINFVRFNQVWRSWHTYRIWPIHLDFLIRLIWFVDLYRELPSWMSFCTLFSGRDIIGPWLQFWLQALLAYFRGQAGANLLLVEPRLLRGKGRSRLIEFRHHRRAFIF